jgi:DNA-binding MarR family transcriptional regulator
MAKKLDTVILFLIDQTSKIAKQYSQKEFDKLSLGITVDQWVLLKIVQENEVLSQVELAKKSFRDPASITRTIDILEKKGLIMRENILDNRRQFNIKLTTEGHFFIQKNMNFVNELRALSIKGFSVEELNSLKSMLLRIQKNME